MLPYCNPNTTLTYDPLAMVGSPSPAASIGVIQIYTRGNYHWYLKQQWTGVGLKCLGFDTEIVGRLFMVHAPTSTLTSASSSSPTTASTSSPSLATSTLPLPSTSSPHSQPSTELRMVDLVWDILMSGTEDGSVAVIDGATVLLTPLAYHTVPPPMSMYRQVIATTTTTTIATITTTTIPPPPTTTATTTATI